MCGYTTLLELRVLVLVLVLAVALVVVVVKRAHRHALKFYSSTNFACSEQDEHWTTHDPDASSLSAPHIPDSVTESITGSTGVREQESPTLLTLHHERASAAARKRKRLGRLIEVALVEGNNRANRFYLAVYNRICTIYRTHHNKQMNRSGWRMLNNLECVTHQRMWRGRHAANKTHPGEGDHRPPSVARGRARCSTPPSPQQTLAPVTGSNAHGPTGVFANGDWRIRRPTAPNSFVFSA